MPQTDPASDVSLYEKVLVFVVKNYMYLLRTWTTNIRTYKDFETTINS